MHHVHIKPTVNHLRRRCMGTRNSSRNSAVLIDSNRVSLSLRYHRDACRTRARFFIAARDAPYAGLQLGFPRRGPLSG